MNDKVKEDLDLEKLRKVKEGKKINNVQTDASGKEEEINFNNLEDYTQEFVHELIAHQKACELTEAENSKSSAEIKKSLLKFLRFVIKGFVPLFVINVFLFMFIIFVVQIRLFWDSFSYSPAQLFQVVIDIYKNTKMTSLAPVVIILLFIGGWLFKKVSTSSNDSPDKDKGLLDKILGSISK